MSVITKETLEYALKLESDRRNPPLNDKHLPINFDINDKLYQNWLRMYGHILITELLKTKT